MTRTTDTTTSLASRTSLANGINADLFISIHSNAIAKSSIYGTEILYKSNSLNADGVTNKILAQNQQAISGTRHFYSLLLCISTLFVLSSHYKLINNGTDSFTIVVVGEFRQPARGFEND